MNNPPFSYGFLWSNGDSPAHHIFSGQEKEKSDKSVKVEPSVSSKAGERTDPMAMAMVFECL
jgi:hypothetical protein